MAIGGGRAATASAARLALTILAGACAAILFSSAVSADEPASALTRGETPARAQDATSAPRQNAPLLRPNATVEQPRSFGYVLGDLFTQRVLLTLNGREFVPADLPTTGRVGVWFERRAVHIDKDAQGRRWLSVDYQLMNSPQMLSAITLPAWKLGSHESGTQELRIAEWPMTVAPLTPERAIAQPGLGSLRPDRPVPSVVLAPIQRGITAGVTGLVITLVAWISWWAWRNWRASSQQPFARALREMRDIAETEPESWHALHRAFDRTAGRAIRRETLPALFEHSPHLRRMHSAIEEFFAQSAARFFEGKPPGRPVSAHSLCRELRRIEKRHER